MTQYEQVRMPDQPNHPCYALAVLESILNGWRVVRWDVIYSGPFSGSTTRLLLCKLGPPLAF